MLVEAHQRLVSLSELTELDDSGLSPAEQLHALLQRLVDGVTRMEGWPTRLLAREIASPGSHLHALFSNEVAPKMARVMGLLGRITGIPEHDPALLRCFFSVGAPCLMLVLGGNLPGPIRDVARVPAPLLVQHLHDYAMAGLQAIGHRYREAG